VVIFNIGITSRNGVCKVITPTEKLPALFYNRTFFDPPDNDLRILGVQQSKTLEEEVALAPTGERKAKFI
jgi:hypothetical protein